MLVSSADGCSSPFQKKSYFVFGRGTPSGSQARHLPVVGRLVGICPFTSVSPHRDPLGYALIMSAHQSSLPQRGRGEHMLNSGQNTVLLTKLCRKTKSVLIGAQTVLSITVKFHARRMRGTKSVQTISFLIKPVGGHSVHPSKHPPIANITATHKRSPCRRLLPRGSCHGLSVTEGVPLLK